jgi:PDZ domain-containing protein
MMAQSHFFKSRFFVYLFSTVIIFYALFFLPTPYYVIQPGSAEVIRPMVKVAQPYDTEKGTFMLTTIRMSHTNTVTYLLAQLRAEAEIVKKQSILRNGESEDEYSRRQNYVMTASQGNAVQAAYKKAGIPYRLKTEGVIILQTITNMPAEAVLIAGDRIVKLDDMDVETKQDLFDYIQGKKIGDKVEITYERAGKLKQAQIELAALTAEPGSTGQGKAAESRPGIGVLPAEIISVEADDAAKQVEIKAGDIGGPSAGLMFSLEIYNQLVPNDVTQGYRIAGTGTIDPEGRVGVIGGIRHKVIAADRAGADIFFAPKDYFPKNKKYKPVKNTTEAIEQAKKINSKMKIVSVETLDDALKYLQELKPES